MQTKLLVQAAGRTFEFTVTLHDAVALRDLVGEVAARSDPEVVRIHGSTEYGSAGVSIVDEASMAIVCESDRGPSLDGIPVAVQVEGRKDEMQRELRAYGYIRIKQF